MSALPTNLLEYAEKIEKKYPEVNKAVLIDILSGIPGIKRVDGFDLAFIVEKKLGLRQRYFSDALAKNINIKAKIYKDNEHIYVKLDEDIKQLLELKYICCKICKDEIEDYDITVALTKNTLLGFYK